MTLAEFIMRASLLLSEGKQASGWRDRAATNEQELRSLTLQSEGELKRPQLPMDATRANLAREEEERRYDLCLHLLPQRDEELEWGISWEDE